jgi:hypothetical protein
MAKEKLHVYLENQIKKPIEEINALLIKISGKTSISEDIKNYDAVKTKIGQVIANLSNVLEVLDNIEKGTTGVHGRLYKSLEDIRTILSYILGSMLAVRTVSGGMSIFDQSVNDAIKTIREGKVIAKIKSVVETAKRIEVEL